MRQMLRAAVGSLTHPITFLQNSNTLRPAECKVKNFFLLSTDECAHYIGDREDNLF